MDSLPPPPPPSPPPSTTTTTTTTAVEYRISNQASMEIPILLDEPSTAWEWSHLLDFPFDDQFNIPWTPDDPAAGIDTVPVPALEAVAEASDRGSDGSEKIRKRDPRLTCENFLAGRIPCACPEIDAMIAEKEEEEAGGGGKKRARTAKLVPLGSIRCQVPGCEADISELKGYHRRHRVCLRCVNAKEVFLDGQLKRYCQQCGKFHILPDFDEGKRSCRRKLECHNKRRRRKPTDLKVVVENGTQGNLPAEENACDEKTGKDNSFLSNHITDELALESEDGHVSPLRSHPNSQNTQSESVVSIDTSGETQTEGEKDNTKGTLSSSFGDNKNGYSSVCQTGRISFKLYDWNPAEFPRRLRHQIFQWLSSMPVELEGYIRPGCTILTVFMAMPWFMWDKLSEDASSSIQDFVSAPENVLFGRGPMVVYLNDMVFRVLKGGTSLMNVKVDPPRLHYVHPTCFEAGKPMEFVACGSNLLLPKFRFLVSFSGKYLKDDYCLDISHERTGLHSGAKEDKDKSKEHQMYKIHIPNTDPKICGPAFVEVENEAGISNFIPILIGDRHVCSEIQMLQQRFHKPLCLKGLQYPALDATSEPCEGFVLRRAAMSDLLLDVAWLLKEPHLDEMHTLLTSIQIQRFNCILDFLIKNESAVILEKMLNSLKAVTDAGKSYKLDIETNDAELRLFWKSVERAKEIVRQKLEHVGELVLHSDNSVAKENCSSDHYSDSGNGMLHVQSTNQDLEMSKEEKIASTSSTFPEKIASTSSTFQEKSETVPLINKEVVMNVNCRPQLMKIWPQNTRGYIFSRSLMSSRPFIFMVSAAAVCFGVCAVVLHPTKVGEFAVSIRRCLFGNSNS